MKTIKFYILLSLSLVLFLSACKQTKSVVQEAAPVSAELENALLWEISGKKLTESSYLFGTIHIIDQKDFFWPNGTLKALEDSDKVVFEINMDNIMDMENIGNLMGILDGIMMDGGVTLKDLVSAEDYQMINDHFSELGLPLFFFEKMKPMFLTVFGSGDIKPGDLQSGEIKSYEQELLTIGKSANKVFDGLETIEYQISIFDSIPYKAQADMLVESIKAGDTENDQFKEMVKIYRAQDLNAMQEMFAAEEGGIEGFEDILLVNRNKNWIPIMIKMMGEKPTFFAVGAGHLGGEYGVIELLRKEGYNLKPLSHIN